MLNTALLSHWQNWARVLLMVIIAFIAFDLIASNTTFNRKDK